MEEESQIGLSKRQVEHTHTHNEVQLAKKGKKNVMVQRLEIKQEIE